jgi:polyferredoxin
MNKHSGIKTVVRLLFLCGVFLLIMAGPLMGDDEPDRKPMGFWDVLMLPKIWVGAIFCLAGLLLLAGAKLTKSVRLTFLPVIFFAFGVLAVLPLGKFAAGMGLHPSPVCTVTKPFLFIESGRAVPIVFFAVLAAVTVFCVVGNKLFCGWVCPIGAIQELAYSIPIMRGRKIKLPFRITNWIRILGFAVFVPLVFVLARSIYDYANPFHALHWEFVVLDMVVLAVVLAVATVVFRPFCYVLCPMGLFTWLLEHVSVYKVRVDQDLCTKCDNCVMTAPCPAMPALVDGKKSAPDCHACGECLDKCAEGAIRFRR